MTERKTAPQENPENLKELYREWACGILMLPHDSSWEAIQQRRDYIYEQETMLPANQDSPLKAELERQATALHLPPESSIREIMAALELVDFKATEEEKRLSYTTLLRLDGSASWEEIIKIFQQIVEEVISNKPDNEDYGSEIERYFRETFYIEGELDTRFQFSQLKHHEIERDLKSAKYLKILDYLKESQSPVEDLQQRARNVIRKVLLLLKRF